jgi:3-hydroxyacyl-CoA dehydrogenase
MEREVFQRLRASEGAAAMRHLFFAERAATRFLELKDVKSRLLSRVGVVGAGTMGSGIAASMLAVGYPVVLVEQDAGALQAAISRIRNIEARNVSNGRVSADKSEQRLARLQPATDFSALADVDLVIEAVFEDMDVKQKLLRKVTPTLPARTIIASNTSYLNLDTLAAASARPENVIGLHFFAPANVMRLLEVVKGAKTAPDVLVTALGLARNLDKVAVVSGVGDGFIGNRIYSAYRTQCEFMVEEGALPEQVDAALEAFGLAMGPFAVGDLSGLDIAWRNRNRQAAARNPAHRYCKIADMLCEAGRLGRKTGAGWYHYPAGAKKGEPDEFVVRLIAEISAAAGITRRSFTPEQIQMRALAAMVNEAALALEDGVARLASDIDLVLVHGYGFPAQRGGPMFWASRRPQAEIDAAIETLASATGPGFRRGCLDLMPKSPDA